MSTESDKILSLSCRYCGKIFLDLRKQIMHERLHTQEKPFKCETCGNVYAKNSCLRDHAVNYNHQESLKDRIEDMSEENQMSVDKEQSQTTKSTSFPISKMCGKGKALMSDKNVVQVKSIVTESSTDMKIDGLLAKGLNLCRGGLDVRKGFKEPQLPPKENCREKEVTEDVGIQLQGTISNLSVKRPRHICPVCQRSFAKAETLKNHIAAHFSNSFYSCKTCHVNFKTQKAIKRHRSRLHARRKNHLQRKQSASNVVQSSRTKPRQQISKKPTLDAKLRLLRHPTHVRRSPSQDAYLWPKVLLSGHLNNLLKL